MKATIRNIIKKAMTAFVSKDDVRQSWKLDEVASQQQDLIEGQLAKPESTKPFATFLSIIRFIESEYAPPPRTILDIGCGVGHYSELLARYFPNRYLYTGMDYSQAMITRAQSLWKHSTFLVGDIFSGEINLKGYDVILAGALVDVIDDFHKILSILFQGTSRLLILHRQRITTLRSYSELTKGYGNQRTFATYLNRDDLVRDLAANGLSIRKEFPVEQDSYSFLIERA